MNKAKKKIYHLIWTRASRIYKWASNKEFELMVADGTIPQSTIEKWKGHNKYIRPHSSSYTVVFPKAKNNGVEAGSFRNDMGYEVQADKIADLFDVPIEMIEHKEKNNNG